MDLMLDHIEAFGEKVADGTHLSVDARALNGGTYQLPVMAVMQSGLTQSVASQCEYTVEDESVCTISRGIATGHKDGETNVTATYTSANGTQVTFSFTLAVETFPLREGMFNPSLVGDGTFDEQTLTFTTSEKGQAGWEYEAGLDLTLHHIVYL